MKNKQTKKGYPRVVGARDLGDKHNGKKSERCVYYEPIKVLEQGTNAKVRNPH